MVFSIYLGLIISSYLLGQSIIHQISRQTSFLTDIVSRSPNYSLLSIICRELAEDLHPWQRSWGRRLDIHKGRIEPQESPWKSLSIYPQKNRSLPTVLLCALTSDFTGGCPPPPSRSLCQRVNLQLQFIQFLVILPFNFQLSLHLERGTHHAY